MNRNTPRLFPRHAIHGLVPLALLAACASEPYGPTPIPPAPYVARADGVVVEIDERIKYDCQGVPLTVEYDGNLARLEWPDGNDVLRRDESDAVVSYESRYSELRFEDDMLWGRAGGPTRTCFER